jgi:uncharacterized membrane protein
MPAAEALAGPLHAAVRIGFERTLEQDPGLGLCQLIDPACKALSPAVNDPYTAIQAIEHLSVLYAALARQPVGPLVAHDRSGTITAAVPARPFAELLAIGVGLIRRYGAGEPTVIQPRCVIAPAFVREPGQHATGDGVKRDPSDEARGHHDVLWVPRTLSGHAT